MQWFPVLIMFGIVAVSAVECDVPGLSVSKIENLSHNPRPLEDDAKNPIVADASNKLSTDGYVVFPGQFPHHAHLDVKFEESVTTAQTSGSLITPNYILTRANVFRISNPYGSAVLGIGDGSDTTMQQRINFTKSGVQVHPSYDIATIRLEHSVTLTKFVQPIRLPRLSDTRKYEMMEGTSVGSFYGPRRYSRNQIMSNVDCHEQHPYAFISSYDICTNAYVGGSFCKMAYGSGLIVEDEKGRILVGVTSSIYACELNYPTVYARVSEHRDWIGTNSNYVFDV
ncbi:brachyurin-like [Anopheles marshallii]|uniref:brachyurin-like n=1 Tax=Anopheles marshallii TaxID=1521116 RepID=UPI00237ACCE9|nr:brachyurin-like [Anopheles marshallii]